MSPLPHLPRGSEQQFGLCLPACFIGGGVPPPQSLLSAWLHSMVTVKDPPAAGAPEPSTTRTLTAFNPACRFLEQEGIHCEERGPRKVARETKAKGKPPGPSQRRTQCQQLWTGGLLSCRVSKAPKNTRISIRPFLATASGLSLAPFPFWNKQCNQVLKIIAPFLPIWTSLAPPSCVGQRSALGDQGRSEGELERGGWCWPMSSPGGEQGSRAYFGCGGN